MQIAQSAFSKSVSPNKAIIHGIRAEISGLRVCFGISGVYKEVFHVFPTDYHLFLFESA